MESVPLGVSALFDINRERLRSLDDFGTAIYLGQQYGARIPRCRCGAYGPANQPAMLGAFLQHELYLAEAIRKQPHLEL